MTSRADELRTKLIRNLPSAKLDLFQRGTLYESLGTSFTEGLATRDLGFSYDIVPPGKRACPYHLHHAEEEMFVILEGQGTLRVADEMLPVGAGDVIAIPAGPDYPHQILNTSDAPLKYLSIATRRSPEVCEYPDSGKVNAFAAKRILIQRKADSLDYWDGEPGA
ncbi:MAG: cupin domain-containing protein [Rubrivivax sp.]|nr:cupin domain-containing protein [Rubrivivax sp.]